jgi:hypothetical protein
MAVTILDNRTLIDHADATTGWSSPVASEALQLYTTAPDPVELSGCIGVAISTETGEVLHTHTATDISAATLVYVWILANGTMDTLAGNGIGLVLGDGTNTIAFQRAGADRAVFRHSDGPVGWQCLMLDSTALPTSLDLQGTAGSLDLVNVTEFGANFKTLSKALGGSENCFIDTIRYGNGGLDVYGGTSGDRGSFLEIATEDRSDTSGKAYGILRELGTGIYSCQGPLIFGEAGTATHYFHDQDVVVNWEDHDQTTGMFPISLQSNATGVGSFRLGVIGGTENGTNGATLIMPTASGNGFDASDATLDFCQLYDTTFKNFTGTIDFSADATNGVNHDVFDCLFDTCGTVNPGRVDMKNCSFVNSSATEAMIIDNDNNTLLEALSFTSDGTGHAIHLIPAEAAATSFTITGYTFTGYAGTDGSTGNEAILVDSATDEDITLTVGVGSDTPTIMEAAGYTGTFTLSQSVPMDFTVIDSQAVAVQGAQITAFLVSDNSSIMTATDTDVNGEVSASYTASTPVDIYYRVRKSSTGATKYKLFSAFGTISNTGFAGTVTLTEDTNNNT